MTNGDEEDVLIFVTDIFLVRAPNYWWVRVDKFACKFRQTRVIRLESKKTPIRTMGTNYAC